MYIRGKLKKTNLIIRVLHCSCKTNVIGDFKGKILFEKFLKTPVHPRQTTTTHETISLHT